MKIGLLSLLIAVGVALFSVYQFENYQKLVIDTQASVKQLDAEVKPQLAQLRARLAEVKQDDQWKVAEAAHLIRLAVEQWQISQDPNTSIRLLAAADHILHSLQDPRFVPLRESLKQDQLALETVKLPDKEGLWLTLTALINKVSDLPTRGVRSTILKEDTAVLITQSTSEENQESNHQQDARKITQNNETSGWKAELHRNLQKFKDLVRIQHHRQPIEPILSESQQALAQETLRLLLEQTRWSILHGYAAVYETSLQQSIEWLNTYFEPNDEQVKQLQAVLTNLTKVELQPKLPEIGSALPLLENTR